MSCRPISYGLAALLVGACGVETSSTQQDHPFRYSQMHQWKLPKALNEVSGLALTEDQRLFAIADEAAYVYELDYNEGRLIKRFAVSDPVLRGDFEGIAASTGALHIITSGGTLISFQEGDDEDTVEFTRQDTGAGVFCEVEGLTFDPRDESLLIACKQTLTRALSDRIVVFRWWLLEERLDTLFNMDAEEITDRLQTSNFNPSAIVLDGSTVVLIAAKQAALAKLTQDGEVLDAYVLPTADRHRQAEGVALTRQRSLLLADEGGNRQARLSVYEQFN
ncbi:MAG: SdiA-regulated domain-containing protein [Gammaproteobacteria bacterium]|nr:SdiA-regulated domain-containing protein [Gammaproteobacteria bacterium]